uniref:NADH-ubiquinone oxidoreductase chain 5 n=1 Tax=Clovia sp. EMHAU-2015-Zz052918 TaxID=2038646 RepID=A0A343K658_9HEMI|nr:NADH dehydrogenase subunit 5 [Clovia sp. EMHAU-2015-Zz052918]
MMKKNKIVYLISLYLLIISIITFILSIYMIMFNYTIMIEWMLMNLNASSMMMSILMDWMSLMFMSLVTMISSMVMFYSIEYMKDDLNLKRFIYLVLMFVLSMIFLIVSPNMISILLGWDGLGLISYCLVIYYQNYKSYNAGMLTSLTNRIGDVGILMSIAWMMNFGSWNFLFYTEMMNNFKIIPMMIMLAAMTKSAQIPFSSWLPAAMAAPTPVSSLVHSSTLVTAGVYLLIRFNLMFKNMMMNELFLIMSIMTMIMAGICANFEYDLKKIVALSTLSQLGFMMSILMMGFPTITFFHLLIHALFKSLLFLCSGVMIHCMWGNQDIRFMGSMIFQLPTISACFNISNLALCGFPFMSGFYSKDLIMETMMMTNNNMMMFMLFIISISLTISYSIRLSFYSMMMNMNMFSFLSMTDCSKHMKYSIIMLTMLTIIGGSSMSWIMFKTPSLTFLPPMMKMTTLIIMILTSMTMYELNKYKKTINMNIMMSFLFSKMWFMPMFSTFYIYNKYLIKSLDYEKIIDQGWGEYMGPMGLSNFILNKSNLNQKLQNNNFKIYMITFMIMLIFMMMIMN